MTSFKLYVYYFNLGSSQHTTYNINYALMQHVSTWRSLHHHKHQGLDPLIRSVSTVTAARANASLVFQLLSFLVVCSGMISKGLGFVAFFASVEDSSVCINLSCLVMPVIRGSRRM